jgi:hypothetical protein
LEIGFLAFLIGMLLLAVGPITWASKSQRIPNCQFPTAPTVVRWGFLVIWDLEVPLGFGAWSLGFD